MVSDRELDDMSKEVHNSFKNRNRLKAEEHQRRLGEDSQYLEDFLKVTEIKNKAPMIEKRIRSIYVMNGAENELPEKDDLLDIINMAHADTQKARRKNVTGIFGFTASSMPNPPLQEYAYHLLKERPVNYFRQRAYFDLKPISYEKALQEVKEMKGWPTVKEVAALSLIGLTHSKNPLELAKGLIATPVAIAYTVVDAILPDSIRARNYMKDANKAADEHFQQFKLEMEKVFELYAEV